MTHLIPPIKNVITSSFVIVEKNKKALSLLFFQVKVASRLF